jgi:hypothetical protein
MINQFAEQFAEIESSLPKPTSQYAINDTHQHGDCIEAKLHRLISSATRRRITAGSGLLGITSDVLFPFFLPFFLSFFLSFSLSFVPSCSPFRVTRLGSPILKTPVFPFHLMYFSVSLSR